MKQNVGFPAGADLIYGLGRNAWRPACFGHALVILPQQDVHRTIPGMHGPLIERKREREREREYARWSLLTNVTSSAKMYIFAE